MLNKKLPSLTRLCFVLFFFFLGLKNGKYADVESNFGCPNPGLELMSPAAKCRGLNQWTTREVPSYIPFDPKSTSKLILKKYLSRYGKIDGQGSSPV